MKRSGKPQWKALSSIENTDTSYDRDYDDIVGLAAQLCNAPISRISLIQGGRQWFKSKFGLEIQVLDDGKSMCSYAIEQESLLVIKDIKRDPRFADLPVTSNGSEVRFYAGAPLITDEGYALGALCVMDIKPRALTQQEAKGLEVLARQVVRLLELRRGNQLMEEQNAFLDQNNARLYNLNSLLKQSEAETRSHLFSIRQLQDTLTAREQQYRELIDHATDMIYELNAEGRFIFTNPVMQKVVGYTSDELAAMTYWDLVHPDHREALADFYKDQRKRRVESTYFELVIVTKLGDQIWVGQNVRMQFDKKGFAYKITSVSRDITTLKSTTFRLLESEQRFRLLSDDAPVGIFQTDASGNCTYVNKRWCSITGLKAEDALRKGWIKAIHPEDRQGVFKVWMKAITETREFDLDFRFINSSQTRWVSSHAIQIKSQDGNIEGYIGTITDITELKEVYSKLQQSEELYRLVSTNSHDIITLFTADETPVRRFVSPSAKDILGYDLNELIGRPAFDIVHPEDMSQAKKVIRELYETGSTRTLEYRSRCRDGEYIWLESKLNPIFSSDGRLTGIQSTARDITLRKAFEDTLQQAKEKAEEATLAKSKFLSMMSHEIRTPMNAILGLTKLMLDDSPNAEQKANLELLQFSGENLLTIINDILDFSKIEAGKIELEQTDFDLHRLLKSTVQMFEHRAGEKGIMLDLIMEEDVPQNLQGDPVRLSQVINNLVGNAIKFTNEGSVTVRVEADNAEGEMCSLTVAVIDTGLGISQAKQQTIFERFSQADSDTTRKFGGTGLGLSISKSLIELMGGRIHIESELGKGSAFIFSVRLQLAETTVKQEHPEGVMENFAGRNFRVLLAEDNKINQVVAKSFLNNWGLEVDIAETGEEAVNRVKSQSYNIILMDIQMPELDGYEATMRIRNLSDRNLACIPIIALTASAMLGMRDKVIEAGMNDFVTKPFDPEELNLKIQKYLLPDEANRSAA